MSSLIFLLLLKLVVAHDFTYTKLEDWYRGRPNETISAFENTLPTLIIHGLGDSCKTDSIYLIEAVFASISVYSNTPLYFECLELGGEIEVFGNTYDLAEATSLWTSVKDQSLKYC